MNGSDRTVARKSSIKELYVWAGRLTFRKLTKRSLIYSASYFSFGGISPPKPHGDEIGVQSSLMMRVPLRLLMRFVIETDKSKE